MLTSQPPASALWPIVLSLTLSSLGLGVSLPVMPLFALELQAGAVAVGLIISIRYAARLVVDIPVGAWSERVGRRAIFVGGIALVAVSGLASAMAPGWEWLLMARVVEGIGAGMSTTAGLAAVADLSTPATRGRMLSAYQASQRIGLWLGPVLGGLIGANIGLREAIWTYAILSCAALVPALLLIETRNPGSAHAGPQLGALKLLFRSPDFLLISMVSFVIFFTLTGAQLTSLPLFGALELNVGPDFIGWALFLSNTVGFAMLYPTGILSDRYGRRGIIVLLLAATTVGLLLMATAADATWVLIASIALGGGNALRGPAMQAYVMDAGRAGGHGATAGAFRALGDLGSTLGPIVASLAVFTGYRGFFLINAALVGVATFLFWRLASSQPGGTGGAAT